MSDIGDTIVWYLGQLDEADRILKELRASLEANRREGLKAMEEIQPVLDLLKAGWPPVVPNDDEVVDSETLDDDDLFGDDE